MPSGENEAASIVPDRLLKGRSGTIDALRGVAALSIVLLHAVNFAPFVGTRETPEWLGRAVAWVLTYGLARVDLFFVISGFCIHLKWARDRAEGREPRLEPRRFFARRFRRLYPAYLATLALFVGVLAIEGSFRFTRFQWYDLALHLGLVHNFDARTSYSINNVLWTLAVEAQLYALYFALVPLRVRFGWPRTLLICLGARAGWFALSFAVHRLLHVEFPAHEAAVSHWFTWALGAWAVEAAFGIVKLPRWAGDLRVAAALLGVSVALEYADRFADPFGWFHRLVWLGVNPLRGLGFLAMVSYLVDLDARDRIRGAGRWLAEKLASVGVYSYSLYLVHELLFKHLSEPLTRLGTIPPETTALFRVVGLAPLTLPLAWGFFLLFERPFLRSRTGSTGSPGRC